MQAGEEDEVLEAGEAQVERAVAGRDHPDQRAQLGRAAGAAVEHVGGALAGVDEPAEDPHQRRLAGAVGARAGACTSPARDLEVDAAQRVDGAEAAVQALDLDGGTRARPHGGERHGVNVRARRLRLR